MDDVRVAPNDLTYSLLCCLYYGDRFNHGVVLACPRPSNFRISTHVGKESLFCSLFVIILQVLVFFFFFFLHLLSEAGFVFLDIAILCRYMYVYKYVNFVVYLIQVLNHHQPRLPV